MAPLITESYHTAGGIRVTTSPRGRDPGGDTGTSSTGGANILSGGNDGSSADLGITYLRQARHASSDSRDSNSSITLRVSMGGHTVCADEGAGEDSSSGSDDKDGSNGSSSGTGKAKEKGAEKESGGHTVLSGE